MVDPRGMQKAQWPSHSTLCQTVYESSTAILHATLLMPHCKLQLLAACERDSEADRALEAFARMEREAPGGAATLGRILAFYCPTNVCYSSRYLCDERKSRELPGSCCQYAWRYADVACCGAGSYGYCEPDLVTFNTLISACAKAGKHQPALQVWLCP